MRFAQNLGIQNGGAPRPDILNPDGYPAYRENLKQAVARVALTGVLADQFYTREDSQTKELVEVCMEMARKEPTFLLKAAMVSRRANFKLFPKLAIATLIGALDRQHFSAVEGYVNTILTTYSAGQLLELALVLKAKVLDHGLGSRAQRVIGKAINQIGPGRLETMSLSDREDLRRLLRLLHPKLHPDVAHILRYTLGDKPEPQTERQKALESLKEGFWDQAKTIREHRLPFNATKGLANKDPGTWKAIFENMSPLQVLLNMKALHERGTLNPALLHDRMETWDLPRTRLLPVDILRPLAMAPDRQYKEILVNLLGKLCCRTTLPGLAEKKVGVLLDFSGSMATGYGPGVGNWNLAVALAMPILASCPDRHLAFFGQTAVWEGGVFLPNERMPYLKGVPALAAFHNLIGLRPSQNTNVSAGIELFLREQIDLDVLFIFTDEQQNQGSYAYSTWMRYLGTHPKARMVIVNVSNSKWHMAPSVPSVSLIQAITPLVYEQFERFDQDAVDMISSLWGSRTGGHAE